MIENTTQAALSELPEAVVAECLGTAEVDKRRADGRINRTREKNGKSYIGIVVSNLLTFFNLVWALIAGVMIALGEYDNLTFLAIIIPNVLIAIVQECRAKRTVEKLSVTTDPRATVIRDGAEMSIDVAEIVEGDVVRLEMGQQIPADARVLTGLAEANESMLTGESNAIRKTEGDELLAGSYLVSGMVYAKVVRVGKDNYVHTIEKAAKSFKAPSSHLFRDLNNLLKYIAILMIPMATGIFLTNRHVLGSLDEAITKTCGSIIGMIPAGVYLLVTLTLTVSVIKLAIKRTLVQDMYSIEMLARADVVCLDKTGTITDGTMCVSDLYPLGPLGEEELSHIIAAVEGTEESINPTSRALIERFGAERGLTVREKIPFSSARKYSAVDIEGLGCFSIGAPHFVPCALSADIDGVIARFAAEGKRVLVLARHTALEDEGEALALVAVTDRIRPNAAETIKNFQEQGVTVKIISGDHAATVASIAARVGVKNADKYLSCETLTDEQIVAAAETHAVFGRVTPEQKVLLVKELRRLGHIVAMTGDGVNDTLALKESNCAIAMADGSEVARKISQIVLLDSDFGTLPDVVREGRRCINNVRNQATLFLMKTFMVVCLSIYMIVMQMPYPFQPKSTTLLELFIIGLPSLLLAIEPNNNRIEGSFLKSVLLRSIPNGLAMLLPLIAMTWIYPDGGALFDALCVLMITGAGFVNLVLLCLPYSRWRTAVVVGTGVLTASVIPLSVVLIGDLWELSVLFSNAGTTLLALLVSVLFAATVGLLARYAVPWIRRLVQRRRAARTSS